ncbi:protein TWIN LOV 1-like isoform X1 [Malus sylvestris]|uniref:protein TWIN LOV 1-like isoform X1 n=1 Tax=Malus sylvestris TaxID=3752 RepID=UPI0021AC6DCE|nr:protein TWIN LOV 1-like isoform X1 [Malus sylvestris]
MESELGLIEQSFISRYSLWVQEALGELPDSFTITDPWISGHPIVFASKEFLKMSGYSKNEVVGRNGRVFQGPGTCRRSVMEVREAIREERAVQINLLNYRKDGTPFWMLFHMCPVFGKEDGRVIHFVGVQVPISRKPRRSGGRNGVGLCEEGSRMSEIVYGSCRKEVCFDSLVDLGRVLSLESALDDADSRGFNIEESCEASDVEKTRAATAINNILSVLTHYSELTGRLVCGKRCNLCGVGLLSSALNISLGRIKQSFVLTDSHLPDMPIVYASDAFFKLTGYTRHEVLGRNCRFLSGTDTDPSMIYRIKESIQNETACTVRILNYRKDKNSFWNLLHISPIRNASGKIAYFVGVQMEEGCKNQVEHGLSPEMRQLSTVGAVRIAVRSLTMGAGASKS